MLCHQSEQVLPRVLYVTFRDEPYLVLDEGAVLVLLDLRVLQSSRRFAEKIPLGVGTYVERQRCCRHRTGPTALLAGT